MNVASCNLIGLW